MVVGSNPTGIFGETDNNRKGVTALDRREKSRLLDKAQPPFIWLSSLMVKSELVTLELEVQFFPRSIY